ncbi:hypothetical protein EIP86_000103 [Pleurotus ostreatoroseus]|nr:hypothetical protein EIP86_000103 [Pleurotus ostreatoroseus]
MVKINLGDDSDDYSDYSSDAGSSTDQETDDEFEYAEAEDAALAECLAACNIRSDGPPQERENSAIGEAEEDELHANFSMAMADPLDHEDEATRARELSNSSSTSTLFEMADATFAPHERTQTRKDPGRSQTAAFRSFLHQQGDLDARIREIYEFMLSRQVNLPIFFSALCGDSPGLRSDPQIAWALRTLLQSEELEDIIAYMHCPSRKHGRGIRTVGGRVTVRRAVIREVNKVVGKEMRSLKPHMRLPTSEVSESALLAVTLEDMVDKVKQTAPTLWSILHAASLTMKQMKRNTMKNPDAQLNTVYLKASGASAKSLDTLNAFGVTMAQKTAYRNIDALARTAKQELQSFLDADHPFFVSYDNLNIGFRTYETRLAKRSTFESGTAATVYVIEDSTVKFPSNPVHQAQILQSFKKPLTAKDIHMLEVSAAPRLREQAIHLVLQFLKDAPDFDFSTYEHDGAEVFAAPEAVYQLPVGSEHTTRQYMLETMKIDESSLQGNEEVLAAIFKQLGLDTDEKRRTFMQDHVIIVVGDQLTIIRIRGVKKNHCADLNSAERHENIQEVFGWFHLQITLEHNLHAQYYGRPGTPGSLSQATTLLHRTGMSSTSVKGPWHHDIQEVLLHMAAARFRDLWTVVGCVEKLSDLRNKSPSELRDIAALIVDNYASTFSLHKHSALPKEEQDDILRQATQWNRDILDYLILDMGIKALHESGSPAGDSELIRGRTRRSVDPRLRVTRFSRISADLGSDFCENIHIVF